MQQPKRINADLEDAVSPGGKARHIFHTTYSRSCHPKLVSLADTHRQSLQRGLREGLHSGPADERPLDQGH